MGPPRPGPHHRPRIRPPAGLLRRPPSARTYPARTTPRNGSTSRRARRARLVHGAFGAGGAGRERRERGQRGAARVAVPPRGAPRYRDCALRGHVRRCAVRNRGLALRAQWFVGPAARRADLGRRAAQSARAPLQNACRGRHGTRIPHCVIRYVLYPAIERVCVDLNCRKGAFVAGLDAGLVYNEFPLMGGRLAPPLDELFSSSYADAADGSKGTWRNLFENPTTVQFDHRVMAMTTYLATALLFASTRRAALRAALPPAAIRATAAAFAMVNVQAALGISTLLYLVPVPLAATHQAGSVALLSAVLHIVLVLRRPGAAARAWRQANLAKEAVAKAKAAA
jgi:hypothetical protein